MTRYIAVTDGRSGAHGTASDRARGGREGMSPYVDYTVRFEPVIARRERKGNCPACGKKVVRRATFEHTINPFNRNPDGSVRTRQEVRDNVNAEADAWVPDFRHNTEACRGEQP